MGYDVPPASPSVGPEYEAKALAELKALCKKNDVYWPVSKLEDAPAQGSNNDVDLLRFLRARSYDTEAAYKQYSASAVWRRKCKLDETYDNAEIQAFDRMNRVQPQWTGRRDKKGVPVMVYVLSSINPTDLSQIFASDPNLTSIFFPAEFVTRFIQRLCTYLPHPTTNPIIDKSTNIIDLSNVGLRRFWTLRSLLQTASSMATAHYPETVERIFVVGAPYFFPTIWSLVTRWFDPATTRKISVLQAREATAVLARFIELRDLPKRFGGELEWEMGAHPNLDKETEAVVGRLAERWVEGPLRYIARPEGDVLMAVGSEDGRVRREVLAKFPRIK